MSAVLYETARAKVNLSLRVIGRRADGYHDLESLVAFADLADQLALEPGGPTTLDIAGPFAEAFGARDDNLVLRAARALGFPAGRFTLHKRIPVAAGLGGGSADAAAALRLIARANGLPPDDPRLAAAAAACGADVPVCLQSLPRIMRGLGEDLLAPLALPRLHAVLVNPGVALATADVFAVLRIQSSPNTPLGDIPLDRDGLIAWLAPQGNDLTEAATSLAPLIGQVLGELTMQSGCRLARMSGSGATCFGLFETSSSAAEATKQLSTNHQNWWISPATLG